MGYIIFGETDGMIVGEMKQIIKNEMSKIRWNNRISTFSKWFLRTITS